MIASNATVLVQLATPVLPAPVSHAMEAKVASSFLEENASLNALSARYPIYEPMVRSHCAKGASKVAIFAILRIMLFA